MSRSWTYVGFNDAAQTILSEKVEVGTLKYTRTYNDGRPPESGTSPIMEPNYTKEVYATPNPWYDSTYDLCIYRFTDGRVLESFCQDEPWSGGPNTFLALQDHETKEPLPETLWTDEEICNY